MPSAPGTNNCLPAETDALAGEGSGAGATEPSKQKVSSPLLDAVCGGIRHLIRIDVAIYVIHLPGRNGEFKNLVLRRLDGEAHIDELALTRYGITADS